jgi:hypothetical protein
VQKMLAGKSAGNKPSDRSRRLWEDIITKVKGNVHPRTGHEGPEGKQRYSFTLSLTSALDGGGWSSPRPGRFTPGNYSVPIVQEAGWAPGPVWTLLQQILKIYEYSV